jgi:hypothetical protein
MPRFDPSQLKSAAARRCDKRMLTNDLLCATRTPIKHRRELHFVENAMKVFIIALVVAAVSATAMSVLLNAFQEPSSVAFTTSGARVDKPGQNLIGPG